MIRAKYWLAGAALAVTSVATGGGCADDNLSLQIIHNQAPDSMCQTKPNEADPYLPHGSVELGRGGYLLTPLLHSNLASRMGNTAASIIQLHTATTEIIAVDSDDSRTVVGKLGGMAGRTRYISGVVDPGGLTSTGFEAIDIAQANALATAVAVGQSVEIIVKVIVHGEASGTNVDSQPFLYPITLTNGGEGGGQVNLGPCSNLPSGFTGNTSGCFGNGQDGGFIECCTSPGGVPMCPAVGTMAAP